MRIQNLSEEEALATLKSRNDGLNETEARIRLTEYGTNSIVKLKKKPLVAKFMSELGNFFAIILWIASAICFFSAYWNSQSEMNHLGVAILAVIFINAVFSFWQSIRAERALEALQNILPSKSLVLRENNWRSTSSDELVPGDVVELKEGDTSPADVRLIESHRIRVDTSHITGESLPSFRNALPDHQVDQLFAKNLILAGMRVVSGRGRGVVFATGRRTEFGKIAFLTLSTAQKPTPLQLEINVVSRRIAALALGLGVIFFIIGQFAGLPAADSLLFAIGIIVANVPEGLMPTLTLSLAMAAQRMAKRNALIRRLPAVEALGSTNVICTDKTGTLTLNRLHVKELCIGFESVSSTQFHENSNLNSCQMSLMTAMRHTHSLTTDFVDSSTVGDPVEIALVGFAQRVLGIRSELQKIGEIPFDNSRRRQAVLITTKEGGWLLVKGAPEVIVERSVSILNNFSQPENFSRNKNIILQKSDDYARNGLKVLGFARRRLTADEISLFSEAEKSFSDEMSTDSIEKNLEFLGLVALEDPLRPEVPTAVRSCHAAGIRIIMITGDHPETARHVAMESGIFSRSDSPIILGTQLDDWNETTLQIALEQDEIAFARVKANQKLRIVDALKEKRNIVAVTGDGVNDAPALRRADVGIAMGLCGTDVARESSDIILLDDNFSTIVSAIHEGRGIYVNIQNFMTYILASNVPEAIPYILYMLLPIPLPLTILQILAIDLGTDLLPALGLGSDPPAAALMNNTPRRRDEHLINQKLILKAYLWLGLWESAAAMASFFYVLHHHGWIWGTPLREGDKLIRSAATATFSAVILTQMVNVFLCRQRSPASANRLIWSGVILEMIFIWVFLNVQPVQEALGTTKFPAQTFLIIFTFIFLMIIAENLRRSLSR